MVRLTPCNEVARLAALNALDILDTPVEARFDRLTRLAARTFNVPIVLVSLLDEDRQWFKSRYGLNVPETPRSLAFCSLTVAQQDMFIIEDALSDPRFVGNALVTGTPHIRFYAGQPIYSDGQAVGTLCVIDRVPRTFDEHERQDLRDLAELVEAELNHAKVATARIMAEQALKALNAELEQRILGRTMELENKISELSREIVRREAVEVSLNQSEKWNRTIVASSYSGFVAADHDGRVIEWNASAERIFGWTRGDAIGQLLSDLIIPVNLRSAHKQDMRRCLETGDGPVINQKFELQALTASGRQITIAMTISAYEWEGRRCFGAFMNDISDRIRTQRELEEKQELINAVLESIDVAVVACDAIGNLTLFNRAARAVHGKDLTSVAPSEWSRHYALYHADGRTPLAMEDIPLVRALKGDTVRDEVLVIAPQDQLPHMLLASGRPLRSANGRTLGAVVTMKDITELNTSREQLEANERQLRAITENLPAMLGKVDASGKFAFLNSKAVTAYGKSAEELIGRGVEFAYQTEDYAKIEPYIRRAMEGERVSFEYLANHGGREMHSQCWFVPQRLPNGKPDGFFAMAFDITARKMSALRLEESEERLRTITDNLPVLIGQLDQDRRYTFANAIHGPWLGKPPQAIIGQTMDEAFGADYCRPQAEAIEQAWRGNAAQCEHEIVRKNHTRIGHSTFLPQFRNGIVTGVFVLTTDATASRLHERSLHELAHTDSLTRLPNRRHFEIALDRATYRTAQSDKKIALLYLDIDYFKLINDRFGHAAGDAVLVEFGKRLRAAVRGSDLVARLAGDEFTVLLNDIHAIADVEQIAQKILTLIANPFVLPGYTLQVGTTIGVAVTHDLSPTPGLLLEAADSALYEAKKAGRNTFAVRVLGEDVAAPLALPNKEGAPA